MKEWFLPDFLRKSISWKWFVIALFSLIWRMRKMQSQLSRQ